MAKIQRIPGPWEPPPIDEHEARALKSLQTGTANEGQQKLALKVIVEKLCRTYDLSFRPGEDGARATDFAEGKRFVGLRIVAVLNGPMPEKQGTTNG